MGTQYTHDEVDVAELVGYSGPDAVVFIEQMREVLAAMPKKRKMALDIGALDKITNGVEAGELIAIGGPTKHGKCHGKGTKILMHGGGIKCVEDVSVGDLLMGPDSKPRKVLSLGRGFGKLFEIRHRGENFTANSDHILALQFTGRWSHGKKSKDYFRKIEISVADYLKKSKTFQGALKSYKVPVDFRKQTVLIDPYFFGLWLGDGNSKNVAITTMDREVKEVVVKTADKWGLKIRCTTRPNNKSSTYYLSTGDSGGGHKRNKLLETFRDYGVIGNKHIPTEYKINDRETRLRLFAGLIDSDGGITKNRGYPCYDFCLKSKALSDDICFLARSLGYMATIVPCKKSIKRTGFVGDYWRIRIAGDFADLPVNIKRRMIASTPKRKWLSSNISISPLGFGEYFGFELEGDGLYLLGDFTVTHNTLLAQTLTAGFSRAGVKVLWFTFEVPIAQFVEQMPAAVGFYVPKQLITKDIEWVFKKIAEAKFKFGINVVFIDNLHHLFDLASCRNPSMDIGVTIRQLKRMALGLDVAIFILCHSRKPSDARGLYPEVSEWDLRDSSFIPQESDTTWMVQRKMDKETKKFTQKSFVKVCNHRRTGAMGEIVHLIKVGQLLEEDVTIG